MSLSYDELKKLHDEYEDKKAQIELKKQEAAKKFADLAQARTAPIMAKKQPIDTAIGTLMAKAKAKIKKTSPTDKEIVKKLSMLEKKRLKNHAKESAELQAKIDEIQTAYDEGFTIKMDSLDKELEKLAQDYKKPLADFKRMDQLKGITQDPKSLQKAVADFAQMMLMDQQSKDYLTILKEKWDILEQGFQQMKQKDIPNELKESLVNLQKQIARQKEDIEIDIDMYKGDMAAYPANSKQKNDLEDIVEGRTNKLKVVQAISPALDTLIQGMSKTVEMEKPKELDKSKEPERSKEMEKPKEPEKRKSKTDLLDTKKAATKEVNVKQRIAQIEQAIKDQAKSQMPLKSGNKKPL